MTPNPLDATTLSGSARLAFERGWPRVCAFLPKGTTRSNSPEAKSVRHSLWRAARMSGVDATTHVDVSRGVVYAFVKAKR